MMRKKFIRYMISWNVKICQCARALVSARPRARQYNFSDILLIRASWLRSEIVLVIRNVSSTCMRQRCIWITVNSFSESYWRRSSGCEYWTYVLGYTLAILIAVYGTKLPLSIIFIGQHGKKIERENNISRF